LSTVMTVYTVYVVSMVMIQMIWKCEEKEFTMNAKRALNSCTYVGSYCKSKVLGACVEERESYCCFNSPLSRIIQEQVRPQLGLNFGDARTPQCGGIPLDRIADIDWSKVNLDEWLGILQQNGKLPDPASLNLDALTGAGSDFNIDGTRQDASERIMERLEGINVDKIRNDKAREIFPDLDGNGG
ncbi:conjugal transfer protein TraN, partial [Salmonella enterica subsp. enterica serovar Kentucky]|nr:conjugal transfer protein TraN [Salmonella enterica subsp. enterica serovar Kentucky]